MNIPSLLRQNETLSWSDAPVADPVTGVEYTSATHTLTYVLAGASAAPVSLAATASGTGWLTTLDAVNSADLVPGKYRWQAVLTAASFRRVIGQGDLTIQTDLGEVSGTFDPRSENEKALDQWKAALAALSTDRVREYQIGNRRLTYRDLKDITDMIEFLQAQILTEKSIKNAGRDRHLHVRFDRA